MFGRYSLDVEGLVYAGREWDASKYKTFIPDADNILPITDEEYFEDDIVGLLIEWLKKVYGEDTLEQNLDFIAQALGNKGNSSRKIIRNYFVSDFFKDHCQTYSVTGSGKRPIYWLFDSGKQNGFKALIYLHIVTSDHGFVYKREKISESDKIGGVNGKDAWINRRYIVSKSAITEDGVANIGLGYVLGYEDDKVVSFPTSSNVFKVSGGGQNFVHVIRGFTIMS